MDTLVPDGKNRRRSCRRPPKYGEYVLCSKAGAAADDNLALALLDVSEGGLRVLLSEPLSRGQGTRVTLGGADRSEPVTLPATVVWCVDAPAGGYCVGLQLQPQLSEDDLSSLTGNGAAGELASVGMAGRV